MPRLGCFVVSPLCRGKGPRLRCRRSSKSKELEPRRTRRSASLLHGEGGNPPRSARDPKSWGSIPGETL